ncbi:response regulator [Bradyrhizobium genosp. P]|uniref:response regulator n=1 Tax=Bradyrhizobium genosp. P TaxID=83641 RepID=UPI003CF4F06D
MNVLIIEDDSQKAERVVSVVKAVAPQASIDVCRSYQSGLKFLDRHDKIRLVILDVSLPTFDPDPAVRHGRPRPLGGYDILRKIRRAERQPAVVILTALEHFGSPSQQYSLEQLSQKCAEEFPGYFKGAIYYSQSRTGWRDQLIDVIRDISQ